MGKLETTPVASLGGGGRTALGDTLQGGSDTRFKEKKILWANLQRIVEKRGRTGKKKVWAILSMGGVTPE